MKKTLLLTLLFCCAASYGGKKGFVFPNVEYSSAKLYLFNTVPPPTREYFYDFHIYYKGLYANSKIGDGWDVSKEMIAKLNAIFSGGVDALVSGLSSCYIPRHGIIFFDDKGKPVASFSACFECQRINFWSSVPLPEFDDQLSGKAVKYAERQFDEMIALLEDNGIPVYDSEPQYGELAKNDERFADNGEMILNFSQDNALSAGKYTVADVKKWAIENYHFNLKQDTVTEKSAITDGAEHVYITLADKGGTTFKFSGNDSEAVLIEAAINNSSIVLPNGVSVGMSTEQVQASFDVWDGIAWPASIVVTYPFMTIRYKIHQHTLKKIEIVFAR